MTAADLIQYFLPSNLTLEYYQKNGGNPDNYNNFLQNGLRDVARNNPNYVTYDPMNQQLLGGNPNLTHDLIAPEVVRSNPYNTGYSTEQLQAITEERNKSVWANPMPASITPTNNVNQNNPAIDQLSKPSLTNRKPNLAAGWGGWGQDTNNGPSGSANFTYYSRFK